MENQQNLETKSQLLSEAAFLPKNPQGWVRVFVFFELVFG